MVQPDRGEVPAVIVDPSHASGLGWAPRYGFEEGLAGVWEEWSALDLDAVSSGAGALGAVGAPVSSTDDPSISGDVRHPSPGVRPRAALVRARARTSAEPARPSCAAHAPGAGAPVAIVIPAYNEEPTVAEVVAEIPEPPAGLAAEVIVVVDGARDATATRGGGRGRARVRCPGQPRTGRGAEARLLAGPGPRGAGDRHDRRRRPVRAGGDRPRHRADPRGPCRLRVGLAPTRAAS